MAVRKRAARKAPTARKTRRQAGNLDGLVARETDGLLAERATIIAQIKALDAQLRQIDTRIEGLKIAKAALEGKTIVSRQAAETRGPKTKAKAKAASATGKRRGQISQQVLDAIASGKATTRADLIRHFGYDGDKPGQVSISNALSQLNVKKLIKHGKTRGEWRAA
jgi:hypothetical protein